MFGRGGGHSAQVQSQRGGTKYGFSLRSLSIQSLKTGKRTEKGPKKKKSVRKVHTRICEALDPEFKPMS